MLGDKKNVMLVVTGSIAAYKAADIARIDKRRQAALEKWKEYHGVLQELTANQEALRTL